MPKDEPRSWRIDTVFLGIIATTLTSGLMIGVPWASRINSQISAIRVAATAVTAQVKNNTEAIQSHRDEKSHPVAAAEAKRIRQDIDELKRDTKEILRSVQK